MDLRGYELFTAILLINILTFRQVYLVSLINESNVRTLRSRDSSDGIAIRYGLEASGDRIPMLARFSANSQTYPVAHPSSYTMGTGSFPGVRRQERDVDHPTHI